MKRYHFKTNDERDARGVELASFAAAKCEAAKVAASILCEFSDEPWQRSEWTVTVTDDGGVKVLQLQITGTELPQAG
jgi:hypothetical protein